MKRTAASLAALSIAALVPAQAQAAATCLTEREVANMMVYAVPAVVEGVRSKCGPRLGASGFLATKGNSFVAKYVALQTETWPLAKSAILKFVGNGAASAKGGNPLAMFAQLPDQSVRPLVDALISQKVGESVTLDNCANVERGIQLASVMTPRDSGALVAFVLAMTKPKNPPICPAGPTPAPAPAPAQVGSPGTELEFAL